SGGHERSNERQVLLIRGQLGTQLAQVALAHLGLGALVHGGERLDVRLLLRERIRPRRVDHVPVKTDRGDREHADEHERLLPLSFRHPRHRLPHRERDRKVLIAEGSGAWYETSNWNSVTSF